MALNIKRAIRERGFEVRQIAAKMGITPTALSQHLNGKIYKGKRVPPNPSLEILTRIADAIGCDVVELFDPIDNSLNSPVCPHCGKPLKVKIEA